MRDVATFPELSAGSLSMCGKTESQSKTMSVNLEVRADSAPSMLPVPPHCAASDHQLPVASQSVPGVARPHVTFPPSGRDVVNVGGRDSIVSDTAATVSREPWSDIVTSWLPGDRDATPVPLEMQSLATVAPAVASVTTASGDELGSSSKRSRVEPAFPGSCRAARNSSGTERRFVYHEENACDRTLAIAAPSSSEFGGELAVGGAESDPSLGNLEFAGNCGLRASVSNETVVESMDVSSMSDAENRHMLAVAAMPFVDDPVDVPSTSGPCSTAPGGEAAMSSEESNMSVTAACEVGHVSAVMDDAGDTTMSCSSAAEDGTNNESCSTLNDSHFVRRPDRCAPVFAYANACSSFAAVFLPV